MASWIKEEEKNREDQTHNTFNKEPRTSDAGILAMAAMMGTFF